MSFIKFVKSPIGAMAPGFASTPGHLLAARSRLGWGSRRAGTKAMADAPLLGQAQPGKLVGDLAEHLSQGVGVGGEETVRRAGPPWPPSVGGPAAGCRCWRTG